MAAITKNSEILFIYDAKMSNPNGDMDNENKPRMDYDTGTNIVSDVRLKRYLRDYFETNCGKEIFISDKAKDAKERGKQINGRYKEMIDVRLFGAVFATTGGNDHLTGPVQFNWGYSLNKVELTDSNTITSSFSSGEGVGKDYRVKYSLIAFNGTVNAKTAAGTELSDDDLSLFDKALVEAIPLCKTRSKEGQTPRLYIRVEMKDDKVILKDLREYVDLKFVDLDNPEKEKEDFKVRGIRECVLDLTRLGAYLNRYEQQIQAVYYWADDELKIKGFDGIKTGKFKF